MTGSRTTCSRSVSTVPWPVGRPPKCKKKSGKTGATSMEISLPPPPPHPRLTPTFHSPVLSTVEEHSPTSVGIPPMEANTNVTKNVLLTRCSPAPRCKGGKETQCRHSDVPEVGSSSATCSSLPSRCLQDGKYSISRVHHRYGEHRGILVMVVTVMVTVSNFSTPCIPCTLTRK